MSTTYKILSYLGIGIIVIGSIFLMRRSITAEQTYSLTKKELMNLYKKGFNRGFSSAQKYVHDNIVIHETDDKIYTIINYDDKIDQIITKDSLEIVQILFNEK